MFSLEGREHGTAIESKKSREPAGRAKKETESTAIAGNGENGASDDRDDALPR